MIQSYEIVPHQADVGLSVRGRTMAELFENSAQGLTALLIDPKGILPKQTVPFHLTANGKESLLVDWLHEVLYWFTVKHIGFSKFRVRMISDASMTATAVGEPLDPARHPVLREIKAVTRHNLSLRNTPEGYQADLILDI